MQAYGDILLGWKSADVRCRAIPRLLRPPVPRLEGLLRAGGAERRPARHLRRRLQLDPGPGPRPSGTGWRSRPTWAARTASTRRSPTSRWRTRTRRRPTTNAYARAKPTMVGSRRARVRQVGLRQTEDQARALALIFSKSAALMEPASSRALASAISWAGERPATSRMYLSLSDLACWTYATCRCGHAAAPDDQVDDRGDQREDDQEDDPDGLVPALLFLVAEEVGDDLEQDDEVRHEGEADDDQPEEVEEAVHGDS